MKMIKFVLYIPIMDKFFATSRKIDPIDANIVIKNSPYNYDFGNGWKPTILAHEINDETEFAQLTNAKFHGYGFLVDQIINSNHAYVEVGPTMFMQSEPPEGWERCI